MAKDLDFACVSSGGSRFPVPGIDFVSSPSTQTHPPPPSTDSRPMGTRKQSDWMTIVCPVPSLPVPTHLSSRSLLRYCEEEFISSLLRTVPVHLPYSRTPLYWSLTQRFRPSFVSSAGFPSSLSHLTWAHGLKHHLHSDYSLISVFSLGRLYWGSDFNSHLPTDISFGMFHWPSNMIPRTLHPPNPPCLRESQCHPPTCSRHNLSLSLQQVLWILPAKFILNVFVSCHVPRPGQRYLFS